MNFPYYCNTIYLIINNNNIIIKTAAGSLFYSYVGYITDAMFMCNSIILYGSTMSISDKSLYPMHYIFNWSMKIEKILSLSNCYLPILPNLIISTKGTEILIMF